jgi:hypothetical protein
MPAPGRTSHSGQGNIRSCRRESGCGRRSGCEMFSGLIVPVSRVRKPNWQADMTAGSMFRMRRRPPSGVSCPVIR